MLFPRESETRDIRSLDGIWRFTRDANDPVTPLDNAMDMPVPASYNDMTQDPALRDHLGDVWYERTCVVPETWTGKTVLLRFGAVAHHATVYLDGAEMVSHKGGYLPFEADVTDRVKPGGKTRVTVKVNNVLDWTSLPPGEITEFADPWYPEGHRVLTYHFDFFNYAGIHRPVRLVAVPATRITDITAVPDLVDGGGRIDYRITGGEGTDVEVRLLDADGGVVAQAGGAQGRITVDDPVVWEPGNPYLYTLEASLHADGRLLDRYGLPVGIRTVRVEGTKFLLNGTPVYFRGFGRHEDVDVKGKGLDLAYLVKDFNLMDWIGANSFRTSHYPYSEELMDYADRRGYLVIDEVPAVGMNVWGGNQAMFCEERIGGAALENHKRVLGELIERDKNHPCVVMWSIANEAATYEEASEPYFKELFELTRHHDPANRPVTIVESSGWDATKVSKYADVVCINRYYGWYMDPGQFAPMETRLRDELANWLRSHGKPLIITEYGADTIAGMHVDPPAMFSEEFQERMLATYHRVFDEFDFVIGEHIWNFADFQTKQGVNRIMGNKKGIFTRQRQPKGAAHHVRERWCGAHPKWR